ncbi:Asch domain superfamily [Bacillus cereus Rock3-44]|nr:Asch domain superfamily [Bacillus cereus Rock3-44]
MEVVHFLTRKKYVQSMLQFLRHQLLIGQGSQEKRQTAMR